MWSVYGFGGEGGYRKLTIVNDRIRSSRSGLGEDITGYTDLATGQVVPPEKQESSFDIGGLFKSVLGTVQSIAPTALQTFAAVDAAKRGLPFTAPLGSAAGKYGQPVRAGISMATVAIFGALGLGAYLMLRKKR